MNQLKQFVTHPLSFLGVSLLVCLGIILFQLHAEKKLDQLEKTAVYLLEKKMWAKEKKLREDALMQQMKCANRDYVEDQLEQMVFLEPEIQKLQILTRSDPENDVYQKRLDFLQNGENQLRFKEENFQRLGKLQEMQVIQQHSVEMNGDDLKKLLASTENVTIDPYKPGKNPPFFLLKNFELLRKPLPSNEEHFVVKLELIKQEIVHE